MLCRRARVRARLRQEHGAFQAQDRRRSIGMSVMIARQGMQLFETEAPDAVVLDYEMPTVNGGVLAGRIRRANGAIPIVMLSGSTSVPSSALTDVDTFLAKAIAPSLLKAAIEFLTRGQEVYA